MNSRNATQLEMEVITENCQKKVILVVELTTQRAWSSCFFSEKSKKIPLWSLPWWCRQSKGVRDRQDGFWLWHANT